MPLLKAFTTLENKTNKKKKQQKATTTKFLVLRKITYITLLLIQKNVSSLTYSVH
jgi:hypothetical protein